MKAPRSPEVIADVLRRYQAGEKTIVIQAVHNLTAGSLYHLLHRSGVELRGKPAETQSRQAVLKAATRVKQRMPKDLVEPVRRLIEQAGIEVQQFCTNYQDASRQIDPLDAYMEMWYDLITELPQLINRLLEKVGQDSGITLGLVALRGILESIDALNPEPEKAG